MLVIGITGGIGSGKSTVSNYLTEKGYFVLDADKIARRLLEDNEEVINEVVETFGKQILNNEGVIDRKKLGELVFSNENMRKTLEALVTYKVKEIIVQELHNLKPQKKIVFLDAPLLFETGLDDYTDFNWVVYAEEEKVLDRVMDRDDLTKIQVQNRIKSQLSNDHKVRLSDDIIYNSNGKDSLFAQVNRLLKKYVD